MADNDHNKVKKIKSIFRKWHFRWQYFGKKVLEVREGCDWVIEKINSDEPFMICRLGAEESRTVLKWMKKKNYEDRNIHNIMFNAGVFPNDVENIDKFCDVYTNSLKEADAALVWGCLGEATIIKKFTNKKISYIRNSIMNIILYPQPWTNALAGKKVLIIHPFIETIKSQYEKRDILFDQPILPEFAKIEYLKCVQSNAGEDKNCGFSSWFDALDWMKSEIDKKDYDIAIIGGGGYGIPLAAHIKKMGKKAIHMAGNSQLLFGIRGKRWDGWPEWSKHFNENWVYPSDEETPQNRSVVEGGSYWK